MSFFNLLFSFKGKINRWRFCGGWASDIILLAIAIGALFFPSLINPHSLPNIVSTIPQTTHDALIRVITAVMYLMALLIWLLSVISIIAITIKRLRDLGWSTWLILLKFIPIVNLILLLICLFKSGIEEPKESPSFLP